jgi:hypothetical protein
VLLIARLVIVELAEVATHRLKVLIAEVAELNLIAAHETFIVCQIQFIDGG